VSASLTDAAKALAAPKSLGSHQMREANQVREAHQVLEVNQALDGNQAFAGNKPRREPVIGSLLLFGLCYIGYIKGVPALTNLPVDLTVLASVLVGIAVVVHTLNRRRIEWRAVACVLGLWSVFAIGAVMNIGADHGAAKVAQLNTITLLCALGPCLLLVNERAQRLWPYLFVAAGLAMAAAAVAMKDVTAWLLYNRLNLVGTSTIGTGRVVGSVAVVAVIMLALSPARRWWLWAPIAVVGTAAVVMVGSRGPVVALIVAVPAALLLGRVRQRASAFVIGAVVLTLSVWAVIESSLRHPQRIARLLLTGEVNDAAREDLLQKSLEVIVRNPLGVGWDGFGALPMIQAAYGGRVVYPHNFVVEVFVDGGWLAGLVLLVLVVLSIRGFILNSRTAESVAVLGLGLYWFAVAQTSGDVNANRMTWVMLTLGLLYYFRARDQRRAERESVDSRQQGRLAAGVGPDEVAAARPAGSA
jgi:O-antigen ligase